MAGAQHGPQIPRKYMHPLAQTHLVDRRLAVLVSQSAGDFVHSHCVPMWDGVSVEVETKQQCKNLPKTTKLLGYLPEKVSPHRTLNSSKFEIKKELQP